MNEMLRDIYSHQAWADAEHWRAFEAHAPALDDAAIRERLHHIHLAQRAFLSIVRGEPIRATNLSDFATMAVLKDDARLYHQEVAAYLDGVGPARLEETLEIPFFKDPPLRLTVAQALLQAAMHSQYHRAQNATRLRELGGSPPRTDIIIWYWKGRPAPQWP
jgi:uncharacterized damage-inducible protein DinB